MPDTPPAREGPAALVDAVALAFDVSHAALVGPARERPYAHARHAAAYALTRAYGRRLSQTEIGALLGGRHHTTVLNSVRAAAELRRSDPGFAQRLALVLE